jgi:hypothetical protein
LGSRDDEPDQVEAACDELWRYMIVLEHLVTEPVSVAGGAAPGLHGRRADPPLPGHGQALGALMTAHEGLRRLESMLQASAGLPVRRRPGSDGNTAALIEQLPRLAAAVHDGDRDTALYYLSKWIGEAKAVHGIDEARRWRHLPRRAGEALPPRCPYCLTYQLVADVEAAVVACSMPRCTDRNGAPPVATYEQSASGKRRLCWADGLVEVAPDLTGGTR